MGEYERTSTAVVNAALAPRIVGHLQSLEKHLQERGLRRGTLLVQSNGGVASAGQLADRPVNLLLSGPAAGVGALNLYRAWAGTDDLISMEIGGTSCDVLLMTDGTVDTRDELFIGGYHVATPSIDIHTIGAGGGTIAGVDPAGMLFVGPKGAGADPGPACYGRGGTEPTVTDAQLVLGRLRPGRYAGTALDLDLDAAREAIARHVAIPLGLDVEAAAAGILAVVDQHLLHAVEYLSIERGHSPARFTLVAAGGAGPMHGAPVARALGCSRVYVPRQAGAFCALGMLHADLRQDFQRFLFGELAAIGTGEVDAALAGLCQQATEALAREGVAPAEAVLERSLDLRYAGQLWSIRVTLGDGGFDPAVAQARFEREYERLYGHLQPNGAITVSSVRVTARASTGPLRPTARDAGDSEAIPIETRKVFHGPSGWLDTAVYRGGDLGPGQVVMGPAVIEELTTTVLVGPHDQLTVDDGGNFAIDLHPIPPNSFRGGDLTERDSTAPPPPQRIDVESADHTAKHATDRYRTARDPVVLALMQHRLDQISRHMGWVMTRTASSPIFSQSHDFSCFVASPDGTLVANADGIPIHTGGGGFAVRALLATYDGRINVGDVFLLSDPYVAGGNHLPDWVIIRPVWAPAHPARPDSQIPDSQMPDSQLPDSPEPAVLAGFCCNRAHQSDIGGGLAGTYNPEATEIWQEGIRLPVLKLIDRGELRDDLWQLLLLNSRTAHLLDGDLRAMLGSTRIGTERVEALVSELGLAPYLDYLDAICDHADRRFREAIEALPDGRYDAVERSDNDCFGPADVHVDVALTVTGSEMTVDFTGSCDQIRGFKNSSLANTYSATYMALSAFFDPALPRNEGTYRCGTDRGP